ILNGHNRDAVFAASVSRQEEHLSTLFWLQSGSPFSHFSNLTFQIDELIINGKDNYPVERTLLTKGALAALMDSSYQCGVRLETTHLRISYTAPADSLVSRGPAPPLEVASSSAILSLMIGSPVAFFLSLRLSLWVAPC